MDLFDLIGPVMIGPSSSHTAGAARIGLTARMLLGEDITRAEIGLHGSFAKTYRGHGTDRALVGGLMGMSVDDERLRDSLAIARDAGISIHFQHIAIRGAQDRRSWCELYRQGEYAHHPPYGRHGRNCRYHRHLGQPQR